MKKTKERTLKPIQTYYNGYHFRSRLEARWAVFFDAMGIKYEYEKEGYDLGEAGWYLPDFWLPEEDKFFEVKGTVPIREDRKKMAYLCEYSEKVVLLAVGGKFEPPVLDYKIGGRGSWLQHYRPLTKLFKCPSIEYVLEYREDDWPENTYMPWGGITTEYIILSCPLCGKGHIIDGHTFNKQYIYCEDCDLGENVIHETEEGYFHKGMACYKDGVDIYRTTTLVSAYNAAKSARFEHGETPQIIKHASHKDELDAIEFNDEDPEYFNSQEFKYEWERMEEDDRRYVRIERQKRFKDLSIATEADVESVATSEGYQITQKTIQLILSNDKPTELLEYILNNLAYNVFVIEPEHIDLKGFERCLNGA